MIFPNPSDIVKQTLDSNNSIQEFIDSKIPYKPAKIGQVYFFEEFAETQDGSPLTRGFDLVRNSTESWSVSVTKSPIENGDLVGEHISRPMHTINLTGVIAEIQFQWQSTQDFLEAQARNVLGRVGSFAPKVAEPVANKLNEASAKLNKVKTRAEGYLSNAQGFYKTIQKLKGLNQTTPQRFSIFKDALILAMRQKNTFTVGVHGKEYTKYVLTQATFSQETNNIYNMEVQLTFEYVPRVEVAKNLDPTIAKAVSQELKKYEAEKTKKSVGDNRSFLDSVSRAIRDF